MFQSILVVLAIQSLMFICKCIDYWLCLRALLKTLVPETESIYHIEAITKLTLVRLDDWTLLIYKENVDVNEPRRVRYFVLLGQSNSTHRDSHRFGQQLALACQQMYMQLSISVEKVFSSFCLPSFQFKCFHRHVIRRSLFVSIWYWSVVVFVFVSNEPFPPPVVYKSWRCNVCQCA